MPATLPPALSSRLESATVYRAGALVTRAADLPPALLEGADGRPCPARLVNLPLSLEDGSVRVRVEPLDGAAPDGLPIVTDVRVALEAGQPDPSLRPAKNEDLIRARREAERLEGELKANAEALSALEALVLAERPKGEKGVPPPESPARARLEFIAFRQERLAALNRERSELLLAVRAAREHLRKLEELDAKASQARQARPDELRKSLLVSLQRPPKTATTPRARLVVEYLVAGAKWAPCYALSLAASGPQATVAFRAMVAQATGEDWNGVRLTFSTALPQQWTELPELPSLRIGRA